MNALILVFTALIAAPGASTDALTMTDVFVAGENGYHTYRIPAIVQSRAGTLLAFCEARRDGRGDTGQIDLVLKRSTDHGATWSAMQVVGTADAFTTGNPAPVVDRDSGTIWLLITRNHADAHEGKIQDGTAPPRSAWITRSTDDGETWADLKDISGQARRDDWRWYATGPVHGIQLISGRLLIPCNHSDGKEWSDNYSHVIYSDDHGETWTIGGVNQSRTNESTVVELVDGRIYRNMRNYRDTHRRAVDISEDGGETFANLRDDDELIEPVCQASVVRYSTEENSDANRILFSNPASEKRENMTIRMSLDETETWPVAKTLWAGPAAYSDLVTLRDGTIGCLFERGKDNPYERITFAHFTLGWLQSK